MYIYIYVLSYTCTTNTFDNASPVSCKHSTNLTASVV